MIKPRESAGFRNVAVVLGLFVFGGVPAALAQGNGQRPSVTDTIQPAALAQLITQGSDLYHQGSCIFCHAVGGRGSGARAPDLSDVEWLHSEGDFEGIQTTIQWGVKKSEMKATAPRPFQMNPAGGMTFTRPQMAAVTAYVWSLSNGGQPESVQRETEFLVLVARSELDAAMDLFEQESERREAPMFPERVLNALGYQHLGSQPDAALRVFVLNSELNPESANVWDSLAEGYMTVGDNDRAIEFYEKTLAMNPNNDGARERLAELRGQ
ncbi:MAG: c-type cytochrome [Gemmatimonadota bacterium]